MKYYTIYRTTNQINGKYYIGKHITKNPYDNYLGSGKCLKLAFKKYGRQNFIKKVLYIFDNEKEMNLKERILVNPNNPKSYNLCEGGQGGWSYLKSIGNFGGVKPTFIDLICNNCGKTFVCRKLTWRIKNKQHFCSRQCAGKYKFNQNIVPQYHCSNKARQGKGNLSKEQALNIFNSLNSYSQIAKTFNVSKSLVGFIKKKQSYSWIHAPIV